MLRKLCLLMMASMALAGPSGLAQETSPPPLLEAATLPGLIAKLAEEDFALRQSAEDELHRLLHLTPAGHPNPVEQICLATYLETRDPEVRARVRSVLADFATNLWSPVGLLGLTTTLEPSADNQGNPTVRLKINKVQPDTAAAAAGLTPNLFITGLDSTVFGSSNAKTIFADTLATRACGEKVTLHLLDGARSFTVSVVLGYKPRPASRDDQGDEVTHNPDVCLREYFKVKQKLFPSLAPVATPAPHARRFR